MALTFATHPELQEGEVFLGNVVSSASRNSVWPGSTNPGALWFDRLNKRLGQTAFNVRGLELEGWRPVFAQRIEVEQTSSGEADPAVPLLNEEQLRDRLIEIFLS